VVVVAVQLFMLGLYLPPSLDSKGLRPPQTIISLPVHTAVWNVRPGGASVVVVAVQLSLLGLYPPPVFKRLSQKLLMLLRHPPQAIIWVPVHTAVCTTRPAGALLVLVAVQLSVIGLYLPPVFKRSILVHQPPLHPPQTIISLPVHTAVCRTRPPGALLVVVAVQLSLLGLYLPPVFNKPPPQTIISLPVHTAVCQNRAVGALVVLVAVQLSVLGSYLPPVFKDMVALYPPQTIISLPVQTAVCPLRSAGTFVMLVGVQVSSMHPPEGPAITGSV
jgi:hypothetical protein